MLCSMKSGFFHNLFKNWKSIGLILIAAILLEVVSASQYYYTHDMLEDELEQRVLTELQVKTHILRETMTSAEQTMQEHVWDIHQNLYHPDSMFEVTRRLVKVNEKVIGACMAFKPYYYPEKGRLFEPYSHEEGDSILTMQLGGVDNHDYTRHPAFQWVSEHRQPMWSDPYDYVSQSGKQSLTTYSYPLLDAEGQVIAVCGLDVSLSWLAETLNATHFYPSSFDLFMTQGGELIAGPDYVERGSIQKVVSLINDSTVVRKATDNQRIRYVEFNDSELGGRGYIYYIQMLDAPHWQVALVCYDREVFGKLDRMRIYIFLMMVLGFLLLGYLINRHIRSLIRLQMANVEKERIDSELRIAKDIQLQMLPKTFTPFPERQDIDIFGSLVAAKEVGGDLFDFFLRDEKLFFCIGDVSGKGVPSAMVMSQVHSLFRMATAHDNQPDHILQVINETASEGNESNMFATFFVGILDMGTGHLQYCNAGHDYPFVIHAGTSPEPLPVESNLPLGVFSDFTYSMQETTLSPNTILFLYTDGLTEAKNSLRQLFGVQRVIDALTTATGNCQAMLQHMSASVHDFVEDAEQSDDLTMLAIHYKPARRS